MAKVIITAMLMLSIALSGVARDSAKQEFLNALFNGKEYPVALSQSETYPWRVDYNQVKTSCRQDDVNSNSWFALDVYVPADSASVSFDYKVRYYKETYGWAKYANLTCSIDGIEVFCNNGTDKTESTTIKIAKGYHQLKWNLFLGEAWENWDYFSMIENMRFEGLSDESPLPEFSKKVSNLWSLPDGIINDTIVVENIGAKTLFVNSIDGLSAPFYLKESFSEIQPGESKRLTYSFEPMEELCQYDNLAMLTNVGTVLIPLNGIAYERPPICNTAPGKLSDCIRDYNSENIVIFGPMNRQDNYTLNKFKKAKSLDLRGTDMEVIFNGGVNNLYELQHIYLPATLKYIDATWIFKHWDSPTKKDIPFDIKTITCMSPQPPQPVYLYGGDEDYTFKGLKDDVTVYVPEQYLSYYEADSKWNIFQILPISGDSKLLSVKLDNIELEDYSGCVLELMDNTNHIQRLTLGSSREYVFHNVKEERNYSLSIKHPYGRILTQKDNIITSSQRKTEVRFDSIVPLVKASVSVVNSTGMNLTDKVGIHWITQYGSERSGHSVDQLFVGDSVCCVINLPRDLSYEYINPDTIYHEMTASMNNLSTVLHEHKSHKLRGKAVNTDHTPITGASITIDQLVNGNHHWNKTAKTDSDGCFDLDVYEGPVTLEVSSNKYFSVVKRDTIYSATDLDELVMIPCEGRRISLSLTFKENSRTGEESASYPGYDEWRSLDLEVINADGNETVKNVKIEYPYIYILDDIPLDAKLDIKVSSRNNAFKEFFVRCENMDGGNFSAAVEIVEYGDIYTSYERSNGVEISAFLFDEDGEIYQMGTYINHVFNFKNIPDGTYILTAIEKNSLLSTISNISILEKLGYIDCKSYCTKRMEVKSGVICEAYFDEIPALIEQQRVTSGKSSMTPNKNVVSVGNYVTVKSVIDILPEYHEKTGNLALNIVIPADCQLIPGTMLIGNDLATYSLDGNTACVHLQNHTQPVRFCILPNRGGTINLNAYVSYLMDDIQYNEAIGGCAIDVTGATLDVLSKVPSGKVNVSGTGVACSVVEIVDDGVVVGHTDVLPNGSWRTSIELCDEQNLKTHTLYAKFTTQDGNISYSENKRVQINSDIPYVDRVEMIHCTPDEHTTTFDFLNPFGSKKSYSYNPKYSNFTFKVWMTNLIDPSSISDAMLWVRTSDGKDVPLELISSSADPNLLVANHSFPSAYSLPTNVAVSLNYIDESILTPENAIGILDESMPRYFFANKIKSGNALVYDIVSAHEDFALKCCHVKFDVDDVPSEELADIFYRFGFKKLSGDENYYVAPSNGVILIKDDPDGGKSAFLCYDVTEVEEFQDILVKLDRNLIRLPQTRVQVDPNTGYLVPNRSSFTLSNRVDRNMQHLIDICNQKLDCVEKIGEVDRDYAALSLKDALNNITHMNLAVAATIISGTSEIVNSTPSNQNPVQDLHDMREMYGNVEQVAEAIEGITNATRLALTEIMRYPTECGLTKSPDYIGDGVNALIDPSGYVYEAVESNRLEGVKTTAYYKSGTTDPDGDIDENVYFWDATLYGQENPLFTDSEGQYSWDVPSGLWQVKFEKDGYETVFSEWLPVPPPQMDVNIGMTQLVNPSVVKVMAYPDSICIAFSKYMDSRMLTTEHISVNKEDNRISGNIELSDEELQGGRSYTSRIRYIPDTPLSCGEIYNLSIDSKIRSYAGCRLADDYSASLEIGSLIKISVPSYIELAPGETVPIDITGDGIHDDLRLKILVAGESFVSIDRDEINLTSENCGNVVNVVGELPGTAVVTVENSELNIRKSIEVVVNNNLMKKSHEPWATIESGTAVQPGTIVYLFSATPNATIYYTLDGGCPCDISSRLIYNPSEGIQINSDVTIKALAIGDNMTESDIVELNYILDTDSGVSNIYVDSDITISTNVISHANEAVRICLGNDENSAVIKIYDMNGTCIASESIRNGDLVPFSNFKKGTYIISVDTGSMQKADKIIKLF